MNNKVDNTQKMDIAEVSEEIFEIAKSKGFWDKERNVGELLMLTVSELGEAIEAHRKGKYAKPDELYKELSEFKSEDDIELGKFYKEKFELYVKDSFEDELADAVIRLFDLAKGYNVDIVKHISLKMNYNKLRERLNGKLY